VRFLCALTDLRAGAHTARVELRLRVARGSADDATPTYREFVLELAPDDATGDLFGLLRDDRVAAELRASLARAERAAEELQTAKAQFLASVSHELRTPLNSIIGFAEMLDCGVSGPLANDRQKENVATIREAGQHLLGVVNSILQVSRLEAGAYDVRPEPFAFADAAAFCCQMMAPQAAAKGVALVPPIAETCGEVTADRRAVQQILINLVANAIKFTPAGGRVTVGARRLGGRLRFWVSDTGIGISDTDLGRIGRPFAQVQTDYSRQFDGLGLGLALVKGLVSLHEGTMAIESAVGAGTTVTVTLPLDGPARSEPAMSDRGMVGAGYGALRKAG
jgi:cell cycle sensor histidine kinase DivJ